MTKEEAKGNLIHAIRWNDIPKKEALEMAIQALSQEPCPYSTKDGFCQYEDIAETIPTEKPMCDRNICISNEYNGIGCDECIVNKVEQESYTDAISRQGVLEQTYNWSKDEFLRVTNPFDYLRKRIKALPSVNLQEPKPDWIPVSERLPEAGEYIGDVARYYLVQNEYEDMLVARYTHGEYWEQIYQLKPIGDEIVAWMPLPKQFKPQKREE